MGMGFGARFDEDGFGDAGARGGWVADGIASASACDCSLNVVFALVLGMLNKYDCSAYIFAQPVALPSSRGSMSLYPSNSPMRLSERS